MQLYERIDHICEMHGSSRSRLARTIAAGRESTFLKYFKESSQKNLYAYIEEILKVFPNANPEWLYRGIGEPALASPPKSWRNGADLESELTQLAAKLQATEEALKTALNRLADTALELASVRGELVEFLKGGCGGRGQPAKKTRDKAS